MTQDLLFHPAAEEEIGAAALLVEEVSGVIERIRGSAAQFPYFTPGTRRVLLRRFPYFLVFRETRRGIQILAVAHAKRRPGYWRRRITVD